jgi:hypothetical protein
MIYAIAGYAQRKTDSLTETRTYPFAVKADNAQQAEAEGLVHLNEFCPPTEGWTALQCRAIQVPPAWIEAQP